MLVGAALLAASSAQADRIEDARAEAQRILGEMQSLDGELGLAQESINAANLQLAQIEGDLKLNESRLGIAKDSLAKAQAHIAARLRALYINGSGGGAIEVILGAESLDDLLNRIDVAQRVGAQDARILDATRTSRREIAKRQKTLTAARERQVQVVADKNAARREIESRLAERQRLYESKKVEIDRLLEEQRRQEARAAELARQRLAAARAAARTPSSTGAPTPEQDLSSSSSSSADSAPPPPSSKYTGVVGIAMQYLGVPYVFGGSTPSGFDCSGFSMYVYAHVGVSLPHLAAAQYGYGVPVARSDLQPGDLVFFNGLGHMGIYIGGGQFIHAPHTGDVVKISDLSGWYDQTWVGARRIL